MKHYRFTTLHVQFKQLLHSPGDHFHYCNFLHETKTKNFHWQSLDHFTKGCSFFWVKSCCCWPIHSEDNHLSSNQVHLHIHVQDLPAEPKSMQLYLSTSCLCPYQKKTIHTKFKNINYLCLTKRIALTRRSQINNIWDNCWKITRSSPSSFQGDTGP